MNCIICGGETIPMTHRVFGLYHWCQNCGFIHKDPEYHISIEAEEKLYGNHNNSIEDPGYVAYLLDFLKTAVFPFNPGKNGLDFGSGPSPVLATLLERDYGYKMDIYDIFFAPKKIYRDKTYDLVISTEVVEHLKNPMAYFKLFKELLNPEGILAIKTEYHPMKTKEDLELFRDWYYIRDRSHISLYSEKTMEYIANELNLELIFCDGERCSTFKNS